MEASAFHKFVAKWKAGKGEDEQQRPFTCEEVLKRLRRAFVAEEHYTGYSYGPHEVVCAMAAVIGDDLPPIHTEGGELAYTMAKMVMQQNEDDSNGQRNLARLCALL